MTRSISVGALTAGNIPIVDSNGCIWVLSTIGGWDDTGAGVRRANDNRPREHGAFPARGYRGGRVVSIDGWALCPTRAAAAAAKRVLSALLADGSDDELTVIDVDEPTMSVTVGLASNPVINWRTDTEVAFGFEFWAPDPLRYGTPDTQATGFATSGGGLRFPLFTNGATGVGFLDFGAPGASGRFTLTNPGTAAGSPQFTVDGPVADEGFDIVCVETGERITFSEGVAAGSTVILDAATGRVLLNGSADKSGSLTRAEWFTIPPGETRTVAFLNRGSVSAAVLTGIVRPPWW